MLLMVVQLQIISLFGYTPLFVLAWEMLLIFIKSKPEIEGMTIFDYNYLYSAYADDKTFFLERYYFYKEYGLYFCLYLCFFHFLYFSGLKPNLIKSEYEGIRVLQGVQVAVCSMSFIDLNINKHVNILIY